MRKLAVSRDELFAQIDRPALKPLPSVRYQYAEWKKCTVAPDYHVDIADHYYSVPSRLIREEVEARIPDTKIEILYKGTRVASHARSFVRHRHTTVAEHMPSAHRRYAEQRLHRIDVGEIPVVDPILDDVEESTMAPFYCCGCYEARPCPPPTRTLATGGCLADSTDNATPLKIILFVGGSMAAMVETTDERPDVLQILGWRYGAQKKVGFQVRFNCRVREQVVVAGLSAPAPQTMRRLARFGLDDFLCQADP
jgi:hypothetical protein